MLRAIRHLLRAAALAAALLHGVASLGAHTGVRELELLVSDDPRKAVAQAERWIQEARRTGERALELKALRLQALAHDQVEDDKLLLDVAARGLALAGELGQPEAQIEFVTARGAARVLAGKYTEAMLDYDEALRLATAAAMEDSVARVNLGRGHLLLAMGRIAEAFDAYSRAHARFEMLGDRFGMSNTLSALAGVYGREVSPTADLEKAIDYHLRAIEYSQPGGGRFDRGTDYHNLGAIYLRLKRYEPARANLEKSRAISQELRDPVGVAYAHHRLGMLALEQGRSAEALELQDRAFSVFASTGDRTLQFRTQLVRAEALAALERQRESLDALARATTVAEQLKSPRLAPQLHEAAGRVHARFGQYDQAYLDALALRKAERARDEAGGAERAGELRARFELQQKEAENALLRARERESEARRLALVLALLLSLVVLALLGFFLAGYVRRHRQVASLALKDDLTGLPNRRSILEYGRMRVQRARKGGEGLCIALIDLDHFKSINDALGHGVGDQVLNAFAETCARQLRSQDRLGRFGGEEFLLVMPGADITLVPYVFERLRSALRDSSIPGLPEGRAITFSLGAAEMRGVADDMESIIQRADRALYRAKHAGRDRFETG